MSLLLVAGSGASVAGDSSHVSLFNCDWQIEPTVVRTYDVAKALERIAAVEPEEHGRADRSLYWAAVRIVKGSTGRSRELANDRKWEQEHLTLDGLRLRVVAPPQVQAELATNLRAWELAGLSQISVEVGLIFREDAHAAKIFVGANNRMVVISDQQALNLTHEPKGAWATMSFPRLTTFSGQQATFVIPVSLTALGLLTERLDTKDETTRRGQLKVSWRAIENQNLTRIRLQGNVEVVEADIGTSAKSDSLTSGNRPTAGKHPGTNGKQRERSRRFSFNAELPDDQATVPVRIPTADAKQSFCVLLSATARHSTPSAGNGWASPSREAAGRSPTLIYSISTENPDWTKVEFPGS